MSDDSRGKHDDGKLLYCSFCGKSQHEVRKLIAGPSVFICDECVDLCNDIIREEVQEAQAESSAHKLPAPKEISTILDQYVIGQERAKKALAVVCDVLVIFQYWVFSEARVVWPPSVGSTDPPPCQGGRTDALRPAWAS